MIGELILLGYWIVFGLFGYKIFYKNYIDPDHKGLYIFVCAMFGPAALIAGLVRWFRIGRL